jgi:anaerobic magnesium-protoporphyrin IX monomethyl ester cyclase
MDEDLTDILATRDLLDAARPDEIGVSVSYPLPGTKFYDLVKAQLGHKTHWQESNDLEMMFQGTYTSDFYRAIRNLLHDQITCQAADSPAKRELESNWKELLNRETQYRSERAHSWVLDGASSASPAGILGQPRILADGVPFAARTP